MKNFFIFLLCCLMIFSSCSALNNSSKTAKQTKKYIYSQKKKTTYYEDYKRVFILEAIYFDWNLRQKFSSTYSQFSLLDEKEVLADQKKEYKEQYYFFILASFQMPTELEKPKSSWRFFLKDWNSENYLQVLEIEKLAEEDLYYQFLEANYQKLDNWTELYLIKADRDFTITPNENLLLRFSNLEQSAQLKWEEHEPFFIP